MKLFLTYLLFIQHLLIPNTLTKNTYLESIKEDSKKINCPLVLKSYKLLEKKDGSPSKQDLIKRLTKEKNIYLLDFDRNDPSLGKLNITSFNDLNLKMGKKNFIGQLKERLERKIKANQEIYQLNWSYQGQNIQSFCVLKANELIYDPILSNLITQRKENIGERDINGNLNSKKIKGRKLILYRFTKKLGEVSIVSNFEIKQNTVSNVKTDVYKSLNKGVYGDAEFIFHNENKITEIEFQLWIGTSGSPNFNPGRENQKWDYISKLAGTYKIFPE